MIQTDVVEKAQAEIDRLRALVEEAYHEGVHDTKNKPDWWESQTRKKRDGLETP